VRRDPRAGAPARAVGGGTRRGRPRRVNEDDDRPGAAGEGETAMTAKTTHEGVRGAGRAPDARAAAAADALARLRAALPLVQAITYRAAASLTAHALPALGATAAMTDTPREAGPCARRASSLPVHLGSPGEEQRAAAVEAVAAAVDARTPWVL